METKKKRSQKWTRLLLAVVWIVVGVWAATYLLQKIWAHRYPIFIPAYEKVTLTEDSDYGTIFLANRTGETSGR